MKYTMTIAIILAAGLVSCKKAPSRGPSVGETNIGKSDGPIAGGDGKTSEEVKEGAMLTCSAKEGKVYKGFGGVELQASGRATEVPADGDRFRVKPYSALAGEFTRVMGAAPASLAANAATFAGPPDRWFVEPIASAVTLFTSFRVAYEAGLAKASSDSKYAAAPTEESATANCTSFAREAWNRLPSPEEVAACKKVALVETAAETDVQARWAYTLASVLSAAGFLAY